LAQETTKLRFWWRFV